MRRCRSNLRISPASLEEQSCFVGSAPAGPHRRPAEERIVEATVGPRCGQQSHVSPIREKQHSRVLINSFTQQSASRITQPPPACPALVYAQGRGGAACAVQSQGSFTIRNARSLITPL